MRHLSLLQKLLGIFPIILILIIALLGNLNGLVSTFPVLQGYADILNFSGVTAPAMTWLAMVQVPNWGMLILAVVIGGMYVGAYRRLSPIYWPQPKITFQTRVETVQGEAGPVSMAVLEAYNQEDAPITDCVATLETATNLYGEQMTPVFTIRNNRLRWSGNDANGDCKLSLPRSARRVIAVAETSKAFQFSSCKPSSSNSGLTGMYLIRVRVDGKLKGNPIEPQYFDGYLYVEDAGPELSMIFGKSDWKKDKRLRKLNRRGLFGGGK